MSWVRIDDRAPEHRKQLAAGPVACWLWVCGLAYCNRQPARDGFIPVAVLPMLYPLLGVLKHATRLVDVGLWHRGEGGYLVHDYNDFGPESYDPNLTKRNRVNPSPLLRAKVFERDRFSCRRCGHEPPDVKLVIDHVIAVARGGKTEIENLQTLCVECNVGKGARQEVDKDREGMQ